MEAPAVLTPKPKEIKEFKTQINGNSYTIRLTKIDKDQDRQDQCILLEIKGNLNDYFSKFNQLELSSIIKEFKFASDLNEIYDLLVDIINNNRFKIIENYDNLTFVIKICKMNGKEEEYNLILNPKPITNEGLVEKVNELKMKVIALENIINKQNNIINEQNIKIKEYENKLNKNDERLTNIENILKINKIIKIPNLNDIFQNFEQQKELEFLIRRLERNGKVKSFELIYSAEKDGDKTLDFHNKCDNINDTISIVKTKNNVIFGGFTHMPWNIKSRNVKDEKAFCFSINNQKIYNVKNDKTAIFCDNNYGPCFDGTPSFIIYLQSNFLSKKQHTCKKSCSFYDSLDKDYEINNGEEYYYVKQLAVYKVKFE